MFGLEVGWTGQHIITKSRTHPIVYGDVLYRVRNVDFFAHTV